MQTAANDLVLRDAMNFCPVEEVIFASSIIFTSALLITFISICSSRYPLNQFRF